MNSARHNKNILWQVGMILISEYLATFFVIISIFITVMVFSISFGYSFNGIIESSQLFYVISPLVLLGRIGGLLYGANYVFKKSNIQPKDINKIIILYIVADLLLLLVFNSSEIKPRSFIFSVIFSVFADILSIFILWYVLRQKVTNMNN